MAAVSPGDPHAGGDPAPRAGPTGLGAAVGRALVGPGPLAAQLQRCAEATVRHLDAAFARIWVLNEAAQLLELRASAGLYTHLDGGHGRVPVGDFKIGRIARDRTPHLTNAVLGDPQVPEQAWAAREGLVAFAGYPLVVEERLLGVIALFARRPLPPDTLATLAATADVVALGIAQSWADGARNHFLALLAHDLNTPLTVVRGHTQLLRRQLDRLPGDTDDRAGRGLRQIERATTRIARMIQGLADLAGGTSGRALALDRRPTDLVALARQVVADHQETTRAHELRVDATVPSLVGAWDADRLERALDNVIGNAVKYSPAGGAITVAVGREPAGDGAWAVLAVSDPGLGIPEDELPRIFAPFYRASNVAGQPNGSGLGLAGVRLVVAEHGGLVAASPRPGGGSIFTIRLPLDCGARSS